MGILELLIAGLCLNSTCIDDVLEDTLTVKKQNLIKLAEELKGEHLWITTLMNGRLSGIDNHGRGTGVSFDLFDILRKKFDFNYTIVPPPNNEYGNEEKGVVGLLHKGSVDLCVGFLPIISQYRDYIHYSPSLDNGEWVVLMKRPSESATGTGLLAPFTLPVWILILLSLFIVGPVIYIIIYIQAKLCKDDNNQVFQLPACIWFVYGALLKQGSILNPLTDSSRLLFATWWLFITVLTAFYTANLTAFLTLSKFTLPINSADEIGANKWKWVTNKGNAVEDMLALANAAIENPEEYQEIATNLGPRNLYVNQTDSNILKNFVSKSNMMFIREKPIIEYVMYEDYKQKTRAGIEESERCIYVITSFTVMSFGRAFAYSKDFKYYELFDSAIQNLVESGIIKYKLREELPDTQICPLNLGNRERRLRNSDLMMTYVIVGIGFCVSLVVFIVEAILNCNRKREINRHNVPNRVPSQSRQSKGINWEKASYNQANPITFKEKFSPPPPYHTIYQMQGYQDPAAKRKFVNGREYWIVDAAGGESRLVPTRAPSALLFQYTTQSN